MANLPVQATSPKSKLLIPALLLVLLAVLIWPGKKPKDLPESVRSTSRQSRLENAGHLTSVAIDRHASKPVTANYTLIDAIAFNPFDLPIPTPAQSVPILTDELEMEVNAEAANDEASVPAEAVQLQAIFFDRTGAAAIIEDRIMRIGDSVNDGRKILRITNHGVELTP